MRIEFQQSWQGCMIRRCPAQGSRNRFVMRATGRTRENISAVNTKHIHHHVILSYLKKARLFKRPCSTRLNFSSPGCALFLPGGIDVLARAGEVFAIEANRLKCPAPGLQASGLWA